jgi:hypothetical protein
MTKQTAVGCGRVCPRPTTPSSTEPANQYRHWVPASALEIFLPWSTSTTVELTIMSAEWLRVSNAFKFP